MKAILKKILTRWRLTKATKSLQNKTVVSRKSTTLELLGSGEDLSLLMEFIKPSNVFLNQEYKALTTQSYQKVCDILALYELNEPIEALETLTNKKNIEILESNSEEFIKFVKWLNNQIDIIVKIYKALEPTEIDSDDIAFQNAGASQLNKYKENIVYYSIDKNPAKWNEIGAEPFEKVLVKLLIDKDLGDINKKYLKNLKAK